MSFKDENTHNTKSIHAELMHPSALSPYLIKVINEVLSNGEVKIDNLPTAPSPPENPPIDMVSLQFDPEGNKLLITYNQNVPPSNPPHTSSEPPNKDNNYNSYLFIASIILTISGLLLIFNVLITEWLYLLLSSFAISIGLSGIIVSLSSPLRAIYVFNFDISKIVSITILYSIFFPVMVMILALFIRETLVLSMPILLLHICGLVTFKTIVTIRG